MKSNTYWIIFTILTCGLGIFPWISYEITTFTGLHDPEDNDGILPRFSTPHNIGMCLCVFYLFIAPMMGWTS